MKSIVCLLVLVCFLGCSSKEKLEVPKDAKPAPTSQPITLGGGGGGEKPK